MTISDVPADTICLRNEFDGNGNRLALLPRSNEDVELVVYGLTVRCRLCWTRR
ncbi:Uncharacterised protein [Mycobacteroides abscessus subsp. massiliense]|nr:Uncharacterised protein [Mycobacteroides abscessus subsp. massiliense]